MLLCNVVDLEGQAVNHVDSILTDAFTKRPAFLATEIVTSSLFTKVILCSVNHMPRLAQNLTAKPKGLFVL